MHGSIAVIETGTVLPQRENASEPPFIDTVIGWRDWGGVLRSMPLGLPDANESAERGPSAKRRESKSDGVSRWNDVVQHRGRKTPPKIACAVLHLRQRKHVNARVEQVKK